MVLSAEASQTTIKTSLNTSAVFVSIFGGLEAPPVFRHYLAIQTMAPYAKQLTRERFQVPTRGKDEVFRLSVSL